MKLCGLDNRTRRVATKITCEPTRRQVTHIGQQINYYPYYQREGRMTVIRNEYYEHPDSTWCSKSLEFVYLIMTGKVSGEGIWEVTRKWWISFRSVSINLLSSFLDISIFKLVYPATGFVFQILTFLLFSWPITVAGMSKAWTVFAGSNTGIVGWNVTQGMDICTRLFCVCVVMCIGSGLGRDDPSSKESYRLCIELRNWKRGQGPTKGCTAIDR
jgi:predicted anti-sigma-YlaC factor YlaD